MNGAIASAQDISPTLSGLTEAEAEARLRAEGPNEIPSAIKRSFLRTIWGILREPMILLLIGAGVLYLLLGELRDSIVLFVSIFAVIAIDLYQERRTEQALEALRDLSSPRALVIRDGQQRRIPGREVVRGDIVIVSEGDRVPADGVLLSSVNLSVDESLLTGESVPVRKTAAGQLAESMTRPGGDDLPCVFSGTLAVQGQGFARILATGVHTELGKIGKALQSIGPGATRLQAEVNRIARVFAVIALTFCGVIAVAYGITHKSWINGILVAITSAMSLLPEEFPVVLTVFLALGAWRISQKKVLTRHSSAIEALGSATVLCVDKTGTLTQNRMAVHTLVANGQILTTTPETTTLPEDFHDLLEYSMLASKRNPLDPMETALQQFGARCLANTEHVNHGWTLVREYPLSPALLSMARAWSSPGEPGYIIAAKGAPEAVASLCRLSPAALQQVIAHASQLAAGGLRVLGVAHCRWSHTELPDRQADLPFAFVGLVGLADPVRPDVPAAVAECTRAGIRVVMITGDYPGTAQSIARQIALSHDGAVLTGPEMALMSDAELAERARTTQIFARVVPEQKLRLVNTLRQMGEIVAMTGDGVNDAPALKAAQIGIAMGARGTDVAREAADLVLMDDSFSSIVAAIALGRRIFDNLRKAMSFIFAVHVPIAGIALIPVLGPWPLILMPVHIVFLEILIDPACSIAFEAEPAEPGLMSCPPRDPRDPLLSPTRMFLSALQGASVLASVLALFAYALHRGHPETTIRTITFATLILGDLMLILSNRSWTRTLWTTLRAPNTALFLIVGGAFSTLILVTVVPFLRQLFRFHTLHPADMLLCLAAGIVSLLWFEVWKLLRRSNT
jgi:Ca2+-transporting ATPase